MKRCAIYTRVSTSNQAEVEYNSCEAQRDRILSYIKSQENLEVFKEYSDPGFSAATLERPALKELLNDIAHGKIQEVLTYKIDRLTRSSKDFYALIEQSLLKIKTPLPDDFFQKRTTLPFQFAP